MEQLPPVPTPARPAPLAASDLELLAFAADQRFVLAAQAAAVLAVSPAAAGRRLRRLRAAGYVRGERRLHVDATAFLPTRRGLEAIGSPLSAPAGVELGLYAHDVGVGWLAVGARRGRFGELREVVGERRMRSEDGRARSRGEAIRHGVRPLSAGRGPHYPDLTLVSASGHRIALELELTTKDARRRERILAAYAADRRFDAVVYFVATPAARRALEQSAQRVGAAALVQVRLFAWGDGRVPGGPAPRRVATRRARARDEARARG